MREQREGELEQLNEHAELQTLVKAATKSEPPSERGRGTARPTCPDVSRAIASNAAASSWRLCLRHALSCLAARGGRLHCPDDAQAERRDDAALLLS